MSIATVDPSPQRVARARLGVLGLFWLMGVLLSTYVSRVPSVAKLLDVTTGRLALLMLAGAVVSCIFAAFYFYFAAIFGIKYRRFFAFAHYFFYTAGQLLTLIPMF